MDDKRRNNQVELGRMVAADEAAVLRNVDRLKRVLTLSGAEAFETTLTVSAVSELLRRIVSSDDPVKLRVDLARNDALLKIRIGPVYRRLIDFYLPCMDYFSVDEAGDENVLLTRNVEISPPDAGFEKEAVAVIEEKSEAEVRTMMLEKESAEAGKLAQLQFMRKISHELRTPLNVILGYTEILREELSGGQAGEDLQAIHDAGKQLLGIIDNVLDFSRLEMGDHGLEVQSFSCRELLDEVVGEMSHLWERHDNHFELSAPDEDVVLETDREKLRYILNHLLTNATEFTEHGSIRMACSSIQFEERPGVELIVADTGVGIDTALQDSLFQPFSQKDDSTTRRHGGVGMGLALCQRYSQILKGTLEVTSRPAEGTRFTLRVPVKLPD